MNALIGEKQYQIQGFLQDGTRVPLTVISAMGNMVTQIKTSDKDGYNSIQLGFDIKKKPNKATLGHSKKAGLEQTPRFFREIRADETQNLELGSQVNPSDIFKPGDIVDVTGISKGKGFAGVVKRHGFAGGPRTHGQSDRERAPGSIGQTTTPGHVYKGKRMAGRMGHEKVTVKNLQVLEITNDGLLLIKGLVPGGKNTLVVVKKVGEDKQSLRPGGLKKFVPLFKEEEKLATTETQKESEAQNDTQSAQESVSSVDTSAPSVNAKEENAS